MELFRHQKENILQMKKIEIEKQIIVGNSIKKSRLGINNYPSGSGKTRSMVNLINSDHIDWDISSPFCLKEKLYMNKGLLTENNLEFYKKLKTTCVLVPASGITQWVFELQRTHLNYLIVSTKTAARNIDVEDKDLDVVLVIPSVYNDLISRYINYCWKRFMCDDPEYIKIPSMKKPIAGFYWIITSRISNTIEKTKKNKQGFLKDLFFDKNNQIDIIDKLSGFVTKPISIIPNVDTNVEYIPYTCTGNNCDISYICKLIEANQIEEVVKITGGIVTCDFIKLLTDKKIEKLSGSDQDKLKEERIIKINLESKFKNFFENEKCGICLESITFPILEITCENIFCGKCLLHWLIQNSSCPMCRQDTEKSNLIFIKRKEDINICTDLTKYETTNKILRDGQQEEKRFLIFLNKEEKQDILKLKEHFNKNKILFAEAKGSIEKQINLFKKGDRKILLMDSISNMSSLNLQEVTDIIFYHYTNTCNKNIVISKCIRYGRVNSLLKIHEL